MNNISLIDQVRQARATFEDAHQAAEVAAAAFVSIKILVGSNEKDRAERRAALGPILYDESLSAFNAAERKHKAAAAHLERVEKNLNTLREELQRETADVMSRASDRQFEAAALLMKSYDRYFEAVTVADTTAQRYAVMPGNYRTVAEIRSHTNGLKRATVAVEDDSDESELPF